MVNHNRQNPRNCTYVMKYHEKQNKTLQSRKIRSNLREEKLNHDCILGSKSLIIDVIQIWGRKYEPERVEWAKEYVVFTDAKVFDRTFYLLSKKRDSWLRGLKHSCSLGNVLLYWMREYIKSTYMVFLKIYKFPLLWFCTH